MTNIRSIDIDGFREAKERPFREFQIWPLSSKLDFRRWLSNFENSEVEIANILANNFLYYSEYMVDAMLRSSIQRLLNYLSTHHSLSIPGNRICYACIDGENPNPTDSGFLFARKLRDQFKVDEINIKSCKDAIACVGQYDLIVFVDDFVGSGEQILTTWERKFDVSGNSIAFAELSRVTNTRFAYCNCISTSYGLNRIKSRASELIVSAAHILTDAHCAANPNSPIWKGMDGPKATSVLKRISARCGYTKEDLSQEDWRGFHGLGLFVAFHHGIPDASMPLFFSDQNDWHPLVGRAA